MGFIVIEVGGSMLNAKPCPPQRQEFSALEYGHAAAIGEAIAFLASLLPAQSNLDHRLQATKAAPRLGFGNDQFPAAFGIVSTTQENA